MATTSGGRQVLAMAVDLGGTKLLAGLVGPRGRIVASRVYPVRADNRRAVLAQLATMTRDIGDAVPPGAVIRGLGVAVPGAVRSDGTVWAPNLEGWRRVPLARYLERATGLPTMVRDDRVTSLLGECWLGAAHAVRSAAFITIGTGIGVGFTADGHVWTGTHGVAGSVGWWALDRGPLAAAARRIGALESQVAGPAILRRMRRSGVGGTSARDLVEAARGGHRQATLLLHDIGCLVGLATANLVSLLDPELIIIGGGIAQAGNLLLGPIRAMVRTYAQPLARSVPIRRSALGVRASFFGAAALVHHAPIGNSSHPGGTHVGVS